MHQHITTGFGWITPEGTCLQVDDPSRLTPMILDTCDGIKQLFNITTERDDRFYLNVFRHAYRQGYLRISKHQHMLGVEGHDNHAIDTHLNLINRIASHIRHKGRTLQIKRFALHGMIDPHLNPERNQLFPRQ